MLDVSMLCTLTALLACSLKSLHLVCHHTYSNSVTLMYCDIVIFTMRTYVLYKFNKWIVVATSFFGLLSVIFSAVSSKVCLLLKNH